MGQSAKCAFGNLLAVRADALRRRASAGWTPDALALSAAVLGPLALYALTMPRTVVLEDDGLFLMAGAHLGVAHPPGYPLHTLLVHLFMQLPFGPPALLGHLSSAVTGALACGALFACARLLGVSALPALFGAWLFGASEHVWSQSIITEVYALNALLFFATFALLLHGAGPPMRRWAWPAAALLFGLALANHWPLTALAAPGLLLLCLSAWRPLPRRLPLLAAVAGLGAGAPYAWMVWRSQQNPATSFLGPIEDWGAFADFVRRRIYVGTDASPSAGWEDRLQFLQWFGGEALWQLTPVGLALALLGLAALWRGGRRWAAGAGLLVLLAHSVLLTLLLAFDYDYFQAAVFRPYTVVCWGLLGLWLAVGLQAALDWLFAGQPRPGPRAAALAAALGLAMAAWSVQLGWPANDRSGSDLMRRYADLLFGVLPENALFLAKGDFETPPLGYFRYVEGRRPDVALLEFDGFVFGNRLYSPLAPEAERLEALRRGLAESERRVFFTQVKRDSFCPECATSMHANFWEAVREGGPGRRFHVVPRANRFFEELIRSVPLDAWERRFRSWFLNNYGIYLASATAGGDAAVREELASMVGTAEGDYHSLAGLVDGTLQAWRPEREGRVVRWMEKAERLRPGALLTKEQQAKFLYMQAYLRFRQGRREEAVALLRRSAAAYAHPRNEAAQALREIGAGDP